MNENEERSGRGVFKNFRELGKPRKYCYKTPSNSGPLKYAVGILTTQPRS
jgi:hypothetical protein